MLVAGNKVRSTRFVQYKKKYIMITALHSNDIFVYSCKPDSETGLIQPKKLFNMGQENHRGPLRCVTMADNDSVFVTASNDYVKVWNTEERK